MREKKLCIYIYTIEKQSNKQEKKKLSFKLSDEKGKKKQKVSRRNTLNFLVNYNSRGKVFFGIEINILTDTLV